MNGRELQASFEGGRARDRGPAAAIEAARIGLWHWNLVTREAEVDACWCRGVGIDPSPDAWTVGGWHRNVHPDDAAELRQRFAALAAGQECLFEAEYRVHTEDYRWVWILQRGRVVARGADGSALAVAGICLDIDERKREAVTLRENEARLATALWGARAAFWTWHVPTDQGTRSALWFAMTGYTREEWDSIALPFSSRLHPEDRARVLAAAAAHCEGRSECMESEYRIRTAQGGWKWMLGRGRSVEWDLEGNATLVIGVSVDIDAQKQAEARLRAGEVRLAERCALAAEAARGVMYECDLATRAVHWIGVDGFLGYSAGELPASADAWIALMHPEDRARVLQPAETAAAEAEQRRAGVCYRVRHRDGHYLQVRDHAARVQGEEGEPGRVIGIAIDVTAAEARQRALAEVASMLRCTISALRDAEPDAIALLESTRLRVEALLT